MGISYRGYVYNTKVTILKFTCYHYFLIILSHKSIKVGVSTHNSYLTIKILFLVYHDKVS